MHTPQIHTCTLLAERYGTVGRHTDAAKMEKELKDKAAEMCSTQVGRRAHGKGSGAGSRGRGTRVGGLTSSWEVTGGGFGHLGGIVRCRAGVGGLR